MAFTRPTLSQLVQSVESNFVSRLDLAGAVLRRSMVKVLSRVIAGAAHMLHGHLEYLSRQLFPDTSDDSFLVRQASVFGISKTSAEYAQGDISLSGVDGNIAPAGSIVVRGDGAEYTLDADVTIASGVGSGSVTASLAGAVGTLDIGTQLSFQSPVSGVDATVEVTAGTRDGVDQESTEALRVRLLEHLAEPAHGGNEADYIAWSKEVSGVTRVWVSPLELGAGTVVVRFARDNDPSPVPDSGEVADVQAKLNEEAPVHAAVTVAAPIAGPDTFDITITPNTVAVRAAVTAELDDLYLRESAPAATMLLSAIRTAIGNAAGLEDYVLNSPVADVTHGTGVLPIRSTIAWS